jgi:cysteine desulfurase
MKLDDRLPGIELNGPFLDQQVRLSGNLNISLPGVESETIISASEDLAISTGAACSSFDPRPSHVLTSIGIDESRARRSLRFGLGRGTTDRTIEEAVELLCRAHRRILESDL